MSLIRWQVIFFFFEEITVAFVEEGTEGGERPQENALEGFARRHLLL